MICYMRRELKDKKNMNFNTLKDKILILKSVFFLYFNSYMYFNFVWMSICVCVCYGEDSSTLVCVCVSTLFILSNYRT